MGNIKKVQSQEYHVPEESKEGMDIEKPKQCNEGRNWQHPNKQAIHTSTKSTLEVTTEWNLMSNIELDVVLERKQTDDQEATKSRCPTNRIKENRIPTHIQIATAINKPLKSRISSPTRALMMKWREHWWNTAWINNEYITEKYAKSSKTKQERHR